MRHSRTSGGTQLGRCAGFSLLELMAVVLILSVLATVAMAQHVKYVARSKRTEGIVALTDLGRLQYTYHSLHNRYAPNVRELGFALDKGRLVSDAVYQGPYYRYSTNWRDHAGKTFVATAVGNLDGDGFEDILLIYR